MENKLKEYEGKTIEQVVDDGILYNIIYIYFTDGTKIKIQGSCYGGEVGVHIYDGD